MPVGQEGLVNKLGVLCVFALALGALAGCGGSNNEGDQGANEPAQEPVEETTTVEATAEDSVVVRVSGTPGTVYSGTYGTATEVQAVDGATVGTEPMDYEVGVVGGEDDRLNASFSKIVPGGETLEVEILVNGEAMVRGETSAELGVATASWRSEGTPQVKMLPKERGR